MDVSIGVKANIDVDRKTAFVCLKLVELYVNQNNTNIVVNTCMDGSLELHFDDEGGNLIHLQDVIKAVDANTDDEGKLCDDITCILERMVHDEQTGKKKTRCKR